MILHCLKGRPIFPARIFGVAYQRFSGLLNVSLRTSLKNCTSAVKRASRGIKHIFLVIFFSSDSTSSSKYRRVEEHELTLNGFLCDSSYEKERSRLHCLLEATLRELAHAENEVDQYI